MHIHRAWKEGQQYILSGKIGGAYIRQVLYNRIRELAEAFAHVEKYCMI